MCVRVCVRAPSTNDINCIHVQVTELHELLRENYVEDEDNMFRFSYSKEFLRWSVAITTVTATHCHVSIHRALQPPDYKPSWYCCIRAINSNKLVGFISGVPAVVSVKGQYVVDIFYPLQIIAPVLMQDKDYGRNQFSLCPQEVAEQENGSSLD